MSDAHHLQNTVYTVIQTHLTVEVFQEHGMLQNPLLQTRGVGPVTDAIPYAICTWDSYLFPTWNSLL